SVRDRSRYVAEEGGRVNPGDRLGTWLAGDGGQGLIQGKAVQPLGPELRAGRQPHEQVLGGDDLQVHVAGAVAPAAAPALAVQKADLDALDGQFAGLDLREQGAGRLVQLAEVEKQLRDVLAFPAGAVALVGAGAEGQGCHGSSPGGRVTAGLSSRL